MSADIHESSGIAREVVDFAVIADWMDGQGLAGGDIESAELITGGTQNVLVLFRRGGRDYVLRRPPPHLRPKSNEVLRREARLLAALAQTDVPAPGLIAACTDESVLGGAVFYLMEPIDGFNPTVRLPSLHASDPAVRHAMGISAATGIALLGSQDYRALRLDGYGNPDGFLARQVPRWLAELETYNRNEGYPGPDIPGLNRVAQWLDDNRPADAEPGIVHGDFHLANMMFRYDGPDLAAMVDWEMSTVGDPMLDLGWLLASWPDETGYPGLGGALIEAGGLPTAQELVGAYASASSRDIAAVDWYTVLACFKLGIVLEGTHARAFAGKAPKAVGDRLHEATLALFAKAQRSM